MVSALSREVILTGQVKSSNYGSASQCGKTEITPLSFNRLRRTREGLPLTYISDFPKTVFWSPCSKCLTLPGWRIYEENLNSLQVEKVSIKHGKTGFLAIQTWQNLPLFVVFYLIEEQGQILSGRGERLLPCGSIPLYRKARQYPIFSSLQGALTRRQVEIVASWYMAACHFHTLIPALSHSRINHVQDGVLLSPAEG